MDTCRRHASCPHPNINTGACVDQDRAASHAIAHVLPKHGAHTPPSDSTQLVCALIAQVLASIAVAVQGRANIDIAHVHHIRVFWCAAHDAGAPAKDRANACARVGARDSDGTSAVDTRGGHADDDCIRRWAHACARKEGLAQCALSITRVSRVCATVRGCGVVATFNGHIDV